MLQRGNTFEYIRKNLIYRHHCDQNMVDTVINEYSKHINPSSLHQLVLDGLYSKCVRVGKGPNWLRMMAHKKGVPSDKIEEFISTHDWEQAFKVAQEKAQKKKRPQDYLRRMGF